MGRVFPAALEGPALLPHAGGDFFREFPQRYLVLREEDSGEVRAVQPLFFVEQDLTVSLANWGARGPAASGPLAADAPDDGRLHRGRGPDGFAGSGGGDPPRVARALAEALERYARHEGVSIVLWKDFPSAHREGLRALTAGGYTRLPSLPGCGWRWISPVSTNTCSRVWARRRAKACGASSARWTRCRNRSRWR